MQPFPSRFHDADWARLRFGQRILRLGSFLRATDPPADRAVLALAGVDRPFALIERGATHGTRAIPDAPEALRRFFEEVEEPPVWVDDAILERGGRLLFRAGTLGGIVLGARSLPAGYASPGGNKPLVLSGRLKEQAMRRLNETGRFVQATCQPGGLRRFAPGYVITLKVRLMHAEVRRLILARGRWDEGAWGAPINQHDMAATGLLFSSVWIDGVRMLGLEPSADEAADYTQLWRYAAHLMGVVSELLVVTEGEARALLDMIAATQGAPDDDSRALTKALLDAQSPSRKPTERKGMPKQRALGAAFTRFLLGDALADGLAVPSTSWVSAVHALHGIVAASERLRRVVPSIERDQMQRGVRFWERAVSDGLGGVAADFRLPERLAG